MTTDMLALADHYDTAIIVSGSQNFIYPMQALSAKGIRIETASFDDSMSNKLVEVSDKIINLDQFEKDIRKDDDYEGV